MATNVHPEALPRRPARPATRSWTLTRAELRIPGLVLLLESTLFLTVSMLAASIAPAYDYAGGAISELGAIPETALLFNASLTLVGVLNAAGGLWWHRAHRRTWLTTTFILAGAGAVGAGLIPLGTSDLHGLFALVAFAFFNLEAVGSAAVLHGPMRAISALAGVVGLAFLLLMIIGDAGNPAVFGPIGHGGAERMIAYPVMIWLLAFGGYLMAGGTDTEELS
ncbi:MAG TPA: DUF998 domain-containing protein [candidate division Zixibacteria bacterium]|nr:DUF998 domain-containing protein [candidate division Zixibacteria bacterium]